MAAGIGDAFACCDCRALLFGELRIAVDPVIGCAVGRRGVDSEKHDVCAVEEFSAFVRVMPFILVDAEKFEVSSVSYSFINLKAGGADLTVYIYFCFHGNLL